MKTKAQVQSMLKDAEKRLKATQKEFDEYDNHDDMDELERLHREIEVLKEVLK